MATISTSFGFKDQVTQNLTMLNSVLVEVNRTLAAMKTQMGNANSAIENVSQSSARAAKGVGGISSKLVNAGAAVQVFRAIKGAVDSVAKSFDDMSKAYDYQVLQETKLETVMRTRMRASKEQIQSVKDYASTLQAGGVIGDEVQLAGAQELATYVSNVDTLKTLMPVLNDIAVQASPDMNVSGQQMSSMATMLGKVMGGDLSGMSRRGWQFTDAEKRQFEKMTEQQRAAFLAAYAQDAIGKQNQNAAKTTAGQIIQLNNAIGDMKERIGEALVPFRKFFDLASRKWRLQWYETILKAIEFLKVHLKEITIVLAGVAAAVLTVGAAFVILQKKAVTAAIASAVAWAANNVQFAIMAGVIVLIIGLLTSLVYFSEYTFPFIGGLIGGVAGVAKEAAAQIEFYFGRAIEAVGNWFLGLSPKVIAAFKSTIDFVLRGVESVARALDSVAHTNTASKITGFRNDLERFSRMKQGEFKLGWADNRVGFKEALRVGTLEGRQTGDLLSYKLQSKFDEISGKTNKALSPDAIQESMAAGIENGFHFDGSGNLLTKDNGKQDIADDFAELIRNRATDKYDIRMSQVTPQITVNGVQISGDMSYEEFVERLKNDMEEVANAAL
ncbi:MAG: hypothetical protein IKP51_08800 [Treponema sp.]|nr:hypothetical protein [Treponema sp.]